MGVAVFPSCCWPEAKLLNHISTGDSLTVTGKSNSVSCEDTALFSCLLVYTRFCLCPTRVCFPSPVEVLQNFDYNQIPLASKIKFPGSSQSLCWIPRPGNLLWFLEKTGKRPLKQNQSPKNSFFSKLGVGREKDKGGRTQRT